MKLKPTFLAAAAGAVTAAGLYCALMFCTIVAWDSIATHPIAYPGSFVAGLGCLGVFFLLLFWYIRTCRAQGRRWLLLLDTALYLGSIPVSFNLWSLLYKMLAFYP